MNRVVVNAPADLPRRERGSINFFPEGRLRPSHLTQFGHEAAGNGKATNNENGGHRYVGVYWLADYKLSREFSNITMEGLRSPPSPIVTIASNDGINWVSFPMQKDKLAMDTSLAEFNPYVNLAANRL